MQETNFFLNLFSNDGSEFGGSIYQKVSDNLETAVNLAWTAGSNSTRFGIAAKYKLDSTASISVSMALTKRVMLSTVYFQFLRICVLLVQKKVISQEVLQELLLQSRQLKLNQHLNSVMLHTATAYSPFQNLTVRCCATLEDLMY